MYEYENLRRVFYPDEIGELGDAVFISVCPNCGRFVKANQIIRVNSDGLKDEPNAECSKCGPVKMLFEGFL